MNGSWYKSYLDLRFTAVSQEHGYVEISKAKFDVLKAQQTEGGLLEKHTLTVSDVNALRGALSQIANDRVIPTTSLLTSAVLGYLGASSLFSKGFIRYLTAQASTQKINARILAEVAAAGGTLNRLLTASTLSDGRSYLVHTFAYEVVIGAEHRQYVPASCTYPAKLVFSEFRTTATLNKKVLQYIAGASWAFINAETNVREETWTESGRDDSNMYFVESGTNNYRVALDGGPLQKKVVNTWYTLYPATIPK
jgi:hypothetical protein